MPLTFFNLGYHAVFSSKRNDGLKKSFGFGCPDVEVKRDYPPIHLSRAEKGVWMI